MTRTELLLLQLAEECAEVQQRIIKALRFGLQERQPGQDFTNTQRIEAEFADLLGVHELLCEGGQSLNWPHPQAINAKKAKVEKFLKYSRTQGILIDTPTDIFTCLVLGGWAQDPDGGWHHADHQGQTFSESEAFEIELKTGRPAKPQ